MSDSTGYRSTWISAGFSGRETPLTTADSRWRMNVLMWIILAVTNLIDWLATGRAFEFGIGELNPLVAMVHTSYGMTGIGLLKAAFLSLLLILLPHVRTWTRALFAMACAAYLALTAAHIWYLAPLL